MIALGNIMIIAKHLDMFTYNLILRNIINPQ